MNAMTRRSLLAAVCVGFAVPVWAAEPDDKKPKVKIEFRRAETKNADGLTPATIAGTEEKIYLHKGADATNADIAEARVGVDGAGNPTIEVTFTKEGAKKVEAMSEKHLDKPLAILIDGKVVSAPVVRAKLSGKAEITGTFTKEEVEKLVKAINGK
jgi:preprotein translocase subunit SecD